MPRALLWYRSPVFRPNQQHPAHETAPSWSWACANGPIELMHNFHARRFSAKASIAAFHCSPSVSFSVVEEAWIDVEGRLTVITKQFKFGAGIVAAGYRPWQSYPDDRNRHPMTYPEDAIAEGHVSLLMIGVSPTLARKSINEYFALVLQWSGIRDGQQCFQRLGMASCERKDSDPRILINLGSQD